MPRPPLPLILSAFACAMAAVCGADLGAAIRAVAEPRHLLAAYATVTGMATFLCLRKCRDARTAVIDGVRVVGSCSFIVAPFCAAAMDDVTAGVAMAVSGILGYGCATVIKHEEARLHDRKNKNKRAP